VRISGGKRGDVRAAWPALDLGGWRATYDTLHMWTQIVGKTRLALAPAENHWWHVALYVTPRGLTTSPIPCDDRSFAVDFDFIDHHLYVRTSNGTTRAVPLRPRTVADFYGEYCEALGSLGIGLTMYPVPVEVVTAIPFAGDGQHASYDAVAAARWWRILAASDRVFKQFRGGFVGKASPVHFFWGSFDLATTRFSGRRAPPHPGGAPNCPDFVMREAYSHECSSVGFWPGGGAIEEPAFYAYAYPEPAGYGDRAVQPSAAFYSREMREFILPYEAVRRAASPERELLAFCETTYDAAADLGQWDRDALDRSADSARPSHLEA
jgi:uncharacterized protein DUF5996